MNPGKRSISLRGSRLVLRLVAALLLVLAGAASASQPRSVSAQTGAMGSGMGGCDMSTSWCAYCSNHSDSDRCAAYPPGPNAVTPNPALGQSLYGPAQQYTSSYVTTATNSATAVTRVGVVIASRGMDGCDLNTSWCAYCTGHADSDRCSAYRPGPQ